jgi:hypothetical protein
MRLPAIHDHSMASRPGFITWRLLAVFVMIGVGLGGLMMAGAWQHNPQGEFHDESGIQWGPWLGLGLGWFIVATGIPCLIMALGAHVARLCRR